MVIEILCLNSIRRPYVSCCSATQALCSQSILQAVGLHLIGILFFATAYLGWAAFGRLVTDYFPFFWLDKKQVGSDEAITLYSIGFVLLMPISKLAPRLEDIRD